MRNRAWWWGKASALAPALPGVGLPGLVALLSVATHETSAGDAWPGSCNWGATTRGMLTDAERAQLVAAHVYPVLSPPSARHDAERAAWLVLGPRSDREIHVDSRPAPTGAADLAEPRRAFYRFALERAVLADRQIVYFTWFAKFATDVEGAAYFASFFHSSAEKQAIASGNTDALARAMYGAHYYTGFHQGDPETNIADYSNALRPLAHEAAAALVGWSPGADPPTYSEPADPFDLTTVAGLQRGLNELGAVPPLDVDGVAGPRTKAALLAWQAAHGLVADGVAGPATLGALRAALAAV